jgi:hypothetical protein
MDRSLRDRRTTATNNKGAANQRQTPPRMVTGETGNHHEDVSFDFIMENSALNCAFRWTLRLDKVVLFEVTFGKVDTCHRQLAFVSALLIPSHANRVKYLQISEYLFINNCIVIKGLHLFFSYHNIYLNRVKCQEISLGPFKCTNCCRSFSI